MNKLTLRQKVEAHMAAMNDSVFLTREFKYLGGRNQVIRVLRNMVREGKLKKIGYGIYVRAYKSELTGQILLNNSNGFTGAAREALTKLGVVWQPTTAELAYNEGRSTQIPVNPSVFVAGRCRRRIYDDNRVLNIEN